MNRFYRFTTLVVVLSTGSSLAKAASLDDNTRQLEDVAPEVMKLPFAAENECYSDSDCSTRVS